MAVDITASRLDHVAKALDAFGGMECSLSWALLNQILSQMVTLAKD